MGGERQPWSLDEEFIRAAPAREASGTQRAAVARRIAADHGAVRSWRAQPLRPTPRRRAWRTVVPVATAVLAVALLSTGGTLSGAARAGLLPGDGSPRVPVPPDAQAAPLRPAPVAPPGEGGYSLLAEQAGRAVAFDPCRPVHYVVRTQGAPPGGAALLARAFTALGEASGLVLVHDGPTDEAPVTDRAAVQPERYGDRYAPVLVAWSHEQESEGLAGRTAGYAGPLVADPDGAGRRFVSGVVVLDAPDLAALSTPEAVLGVVLHELGHLVGLGHVDDPADTMHTASAPAVDFTVGARRGLARLAAAPCFR